MTEVSRTEDTLSSVYYKRFITQILKCLGKKKNIKLIFILKIN
jgi:hypothetical protein